MKDNYKIIVENLKREIEGKNLTCIAYTGDELFCSYERGVKPIIDFLDKGHLSEGIIVDKVIGRASAMFMIKGSVKYVHGLIISNLAAEILEKNKISFSGDKFVEKIINRKGDGLCPMESAVADIEDIEEGINIIKNKIKEMKNNM